MSNRSVLLIVGVVAVAATLYFFKASESDKPANTDNEIYQDEPAPAAQADFSAPAVVDTEVSEDVSVAHPNEKPAVLSGGLDSTVTELTMQKFSQHMQFMSKCLGMDSRQAPTQKSEPTIESLMDQLRPAMGESQAQVHDWTQTEIVGKDGVRRRVRVDYDYSDETSEPARRLSMYRINQYGMPEIVVLTPDQMDNPNEAYVHSLIEGNRVMAEESAARVYFANGEELVFSIRNGNLNGISVTRGFNSFNCQNLDEDRSACSCP